MSISTPPVTAEQLFDMPDDGLRRELVQGEVFTMNPAGFAHGAMSARLARLLDDHVERHRLGVVVGAETGFILARNPDTVRAPDAAFVRQERVEAVTALQKFFPGPPDVRVFGEQDFLESPELLPGFRLIVGEIFPNVQRAPQF